MALGEDGPGAALPLGDVLDFMRLIWAVDRSLQLASRRMEATLGVSGPERLVVRIVGTFPGIAAGRIAEILQVHPSTLTGILKTLGASGLLQRKADAQDGRRALFSLSAKGRKLDAVRRGTIEAAVRRLLARGPEKLRAAQETLAALAQELDGEV